MADVLVEGQENAVVHPVGRADGSQQLLDLLEAERVAVGSADRFGQSISEEDQQVAILENDRQCLQVDAATQAQG